MAGCPTWTFDGITQQVWTCLLNRARPMGLPAPPGNSGTVSSHGATVRYDWDPDAGTLSITVEHKPGEVTCDQVLLALTSAVRQCGGR
jgi:hypothetical protein